MVGAGCQLLFDSRRKELGRLSGTCRYRLWQLCGAGHHPRDLDKIRAPGSYDCIDRLPADLLIGLDRNVRESHSLSTLLASSGEIRLSRQSSSKVSAMLPAAG